jgi:hypothetical protein
MNIDGTVLRAMTEELQALRKEAMEKEAVLGLLGRVGGAAIKQVGKGARGLAKWKPDTFGKLPGQMAGALQKGRQAVGGTALRRGVGAATLGTAGLGAAATLRRPQQR